MQNSSGILTQAKLKEVLKYDPAIGVFSWSTTTPNRKKRGTFAGYIAWDGTVTINIGGKNYSAARLAYLYMTGRMPEGRMTHINGKRNCNRWDNLREARSAINPTKQAKPAKRTKIQRKQPASTLGAGSYKVLRARFGAQYTP